jgi:hypothetical protein
MSEPLVATPACERRFAADMVGGNLRVRNRLLKQKPSRKPAMYIGVFDWWREHFGRAEDQPLILALVLVLIAITLYVFL